MQYTEIVSHGGTTHLINPKPRFMSGGAALAHGRTQTLCEMHLKPEEAKLPAIRRCEFCDKEAKRI